MQNKSKVILISHLPLPYHGIGSWTTLYHNYMIKGRHQIDAIICPPLSKEKYIDIDYLFFTNSKIKKIKNKLLYNRFHHILSRLKAYISKYKNYRFVIQIVDNIGLVLALNVFLTKHSLRGQVYIQYSFHGFSIQSENLMKKINASCDEIIFLTQIAYQDNLKRHTLLPKYVSILNNGIDTNKFKQIAKKDENDKTTFIWCSQDRPKKGLHIILEAWSKFHKLYPNSELQIVGTYKTYQVEGVKCLGRISNDQLPEVYQNADVYLFPTLCHEGFGLTLVEALHCGCFCIASNIGGVPEVLNHGEYGWLISEPHNTDEWLNAMITYEREKPKHPKILKNKYSLESWSNGMNEIILKAKNRIELNIC
ncbi:glycosyltransferase family 4 protein [Psychroflexus sp. ALD_RP9]|uniref:glycosyltransferase family 4 protein n=1 Tax=Psychroflexus sp. ALD_RP9 TaxID=2777186 RepID=UPI001A8CB64A|nr:glycosyltransferase family 4 protein [Psychroflexus sp. ALD_RP9]QSS96403.1 glycosyltransferase family 4 protein [Psychroflexus sp. ALD_RP9]